MSTLLLDDTTRLTIETIRATCSRFRDQQGSIGFHRLRPERFVVAQSRSRRRFIRSRRVDAPVEFGGDRPAFALPYGGYGNSRREAIYRLERTIEIAVRERG